MTRTRQALLRISLVGCLLALGSTSAFAQAGMQVSHRGELLDDERQPLSGVFPMTFTMYIEDAEAPLWVESRYVAVAGGNYELLLGRSTPLSEDLEGREVELAISIDGAGEIARYPLTLRAWTPPVDAAENARIERMTFSDLAGRAISTETADHADVCRTLQGVTAVELDRFEELRDRLREIRDLMVDAQETTVGLDTVTLNRIGGAGGTRDILVRCPPGYIVSGARGGMGQLVDGIQFICTRLESP